MSVKDRIRKLLNVTAENNATEGEIENAMRAAKALMMAHHLSEADIAEHNAGVREEIRFAKACTYTTYKGMQDWETRIGHFVIKFFGTVDWFRSSDVNKTREDGTLIFDKDGRPETATRLTFYGPEEDVEMAREMFSELCLTVATLARMKFGSIYRPDGRSYANGFGDGLMTKLETVVQQLSNDSQSKALVVQSEKHALAIRNDAKKWLGIKLVKGRKAYGSRRVNPTAYNSGYTDGKEQAVTKERRRKISER